MTNKAELWGVGFYLISFGQKRKSAFIVWIWGLECRIIKIKRKGMNNIIKVIDCISNDIIPTSS